MESARLQRSHCHQRPSPSYSSAFPYASYAIGPSCVFSASTWCRCLRRRLTRTGVFCASPFSVFCAICPSCVFLPRHGVGFLLVLLFLFFVRFVLLAFSLPHVLFRRGLVNVLNVLGLRRCCAGAVLGRSCCKCCLAKFLGVQQVESEVCEVDCGWCWCWCTPATPVRRGNAAWRRSSNAWHQISVLAPHPAHQITIRWRYLSLALWFAARGLLRLALSWLPLALAAMVVVHLLPLALSCCRGLLPLALMSALALAAWRLKHFPAPLHPHHREPVKTFVIMSAVLRGLDGTIGREAIL